MAFLFLPDEFLPSSWTKLHIAAYHNDIVSIAAILDTSCGVDKEDKHQRTALRVALQHGRREAAVLLIENGASLEKAAGSKNVFVISSNLYDFGVYLLSRETARASLGEFESFLVAAACNACMEGDFPLLQAVVSVSRSCLQGSDCIGLSPVHYAVIGGHIECLETLLSYSVDPDTVSPIYKSTPLHFACKLGHSAIALFLLKSSSSPEVALTRQNPAGSTPLHLALSYYHWNTVSDILNSQHGQCVGDSYCTLLDKCGYSVAGLLQCLRCDQVLPSSYQMLIPCLSQKEATRLLFNSVYSNATHLVSYAIQQGAKISCIDKRLQVTPLMLAARIGLVDIVHVLLDNEADMCFTDSSGRTTLHYAAREGHHDIVHTLLNAAGSSRSILMARSKDGFTPLELAVMNQQKHTVLALLDSDLTWFSEENWLNLLNLAVGWVDRELLQLLSLVFPSNWIGLMVSSDVSCTTTPTSSIRNTRRKKVIERQPVELYYPLHLAVTLGNMEVVQFILSRCSNRRTILEWKDSHGRSVASLLGGTDYKSFLYDSNWEDEIMSVMKNDFTTDYINFKCAVLQHVIIVHCLARSCLLDNRFRSDPSPLKKWPDWYIEKRVSGLLEINYTVDLCSEQDQLMIVEEILNRFLNRDAYLLALPMWTAVMGGASIAMVALILRHGGSWFVSRSNIDSQVDNSCSIHCLEASKYQFPALVLAIQARHSSLASYLNLIEEDNLVFPTDEDTVKVFLSCLPTLLSLGHYSFATWFLKGHKVYLDSLVLCRHGSRMLYLSCFADSEKGTTLAQLLIDGYFGLVCQLLSSSENDDEMIMAKLHLSVTLSALNMVLSAGPSVSLFGTVKSLACLFNICIQHYQSLPTLFCYLCGWGYTDVVRLILDHDVRLLHSVRDSYQRSPLYYAAVGGHLELVRLLLAGGAGGYPPAILGALVYLVLNNPKRTCLPTVVLSCVPNYIYYLYKRDWSFHSEVLAAASRAHHLCPSVGVLFSNISQHPDQSKELISVLLDSTSEDDLKPSFLYLRLLALVHDLSIVESFISRFLQFLVASLDSTPPPFSCDYLMSHVDPASLHTSPELLTSIVTPMVTLKPLEYPAVAGQKGYWTILSAMFTPELVKCWKSSNEKIRVFTSEDEFVFSCLVTLFYAVRAQEEAIAAQVLKFLTSCELGIEYLAGLPSKSIDSENIIFLCCKYRSLSILQQLMEVELMQDKVADAVNMAVRVGNLEVLQWLDMSWPTILRCKYWSLVLLAGSRDRLGIVEWLFTILAQVTVHSTDIERAVLFWGTVLQGAAKGAHEDTGLCALGQLSLSDMAQLANHPIFLHAVYWCCCHGLVRLLDAMCVSDQALFFKTVHGTTPFHCAVLNGMVGKLSDLDVFPKIATPASFFSLASNSLVSSSKWKSDWDHGSFFIECLSAGWFKHLLDKPAEDSGDSFSLLRPVVTCSFKQVGPRVNMFLQSVAIGNEPVVQAFLSVWSDNASCILHHLQTMLSCRVLQLACNHPAILEMLMKALFSASLIAGSISVNVLEACIKSNKLRSLQLLTQSGPTYLTLLTDARSKRNALHFAAENRVSRQVAAHILALLGERSAEFCRARSSHDLSPLMTAAYLGQCQLVSLFCAELGIEQERQAAVSPLPIDISYKFAEFKNDFMLEEDLLRVGWFNELMNENEAKSNTLLQTDQQLYLTVPGLRECVTSLNFKTFAARHLYNHLPVFTSGLQSNKRSFTDYLRQATFYLSKGYSDEFIEYIQKLKSVGYSNADEIIGLSFIAASTLGREKVVEFMLKNGFVPSSDNDFGVINGNSVQACLSAVGFGYLEVVCCIMTHFPQNIEVMRITIDGVKSTEEEDNQNDDEEEKEIEGDHSTFPQLSRMILFYGWGNIVRHFAQPSGDSRLLLADVWLTHKFGKHQIEYLQKWRLIEEEWTVESIPVKFDNGKTIELKIDWNSFRHSIPNSHIPPVPVGFHAYVISSVLGQLGPFSKSASLTIADLYSSCSAVQTLSVSCVQSPSQPYCQLDDQSATLVVSYCSVTKEFSFPFVHEDEPPVPDYNIVPYSYTISVPDQLLMLSNQMRRWALLRRIPSKVDYSDDFFQLTRQSLSYVNPCVSMVMKDIQSALDLAGRPVALYLESGLIPYWFRNLYQTLFTWLTPVKLFNAVHIELALGHSEQVSVELVEEEQRNVIIFSVTLTHHEKCSPPTHTDIFMQLSRCLLAAETELLTSQTQQFFSDMWAHQTGTSTLVDVLLENKDGLVTPLHQVTTDHIFFLKLYPLYAKAVTNLVTQQECLIKHSNLHTSPVYSSLRVVLSLARESSRIDHSTQPPSMVLSLWDLLHDTMFPALQFLQFLFWTQGVSIQSLSHLPCAMLSLAYGPVLTATNYHITMHLKAHNIFNEPISGSQVESLFKVECLRCNIGKSKIYSITACDYPLHGSPITVQSVEYASSVSKHTHEQANMPDPIIAIAGHHNNQCCWWKKTTPTGWHYLRCMSEQKSHCWIVVKPLIRELYDSKIALFVGYKKRDASYKIISESKLTATALPMNCNLTMIKVFFNRTVPLQIAAFCIKCHQLLKVSWPGETTCLPRCCLFRPSTTPSPRYSIVRANPPKRIAPFSNRYTTKVPLFKVTAGKLFQFFLIPRDEEGNLIDLIATHLKTNLRLLIPNGGLHAHQVSSLSIASLENSDERETVQCQMFRTVVGRQDEIAHCFNCACTLYNAGTHLLLFTVNDEKTTIAHMKVCPQPHPAHYVLGIKESSLTTQLLKEISCPLLAYDIFFNQIHQFNHSLISATVTGPSGRSVPCEIKLKSSQVLISFTLDDPKLSHLNVMVADRHVHGSPLPLVLLKAKPHLSIPFKERFAELQSELRYEHEQYVSPTVVIDRDSLLDSAVRAVHPEYFHHALRVMFKNELGIDVGGVTREFFLLLTQEMVNPDYALFECVEDGRYKPYHNSSINPEHMFYFEFFGKLIAKIISSKCSMTVRLTPAVYRILTGDEDEYNRLQNVLVDLMEENETLARSLNHVLECEDQDQLDDLTAHFTAQLARFGAVTTIELEEGGTDRRVTLVNKRRYVHKVARFYLIGCIDSQLKAILKGVHCLIQPQQLAMFTASELEEILSGATIISLSYIRPRTVYRVYTENSTDIAWLWTVLERFTQDERRQFLQFCTGAGTLPSNDSTNWKLTIAKANLDSTHLPYATTCSNILYLPTYSSAGQLETKLRKALQMGQGFHTY